MATQNYALKKGVLLEIFGEPSKTCTNDTITDEIGDWVMKNRPELKIYFERMRNIAPAPQSRPRIEIIAPAEKPTEAQDLIAEVLETKKKPAKVKK
jgi:hypothetical protein